VEVGRAAADFCLVRVPFRRSFFRMLTPALSVVHHLVVGVIFAGKAKGGRAAFGSGVVGGKGRGLFGPALGF
jgi:hypothetical protein